MVTTKFCDTSRSPKNFPATNVWSWRHQAGKCCIMRGWSWVQQKRSDNGRRYWGLLCSWETGSTHFPRTSLSTRRVQWTRSLGLCQKFPPSSKCCVWVEAMNWYTSSGRNLLCLLSVSTWMLCGHAMSSWLVLTLSPCFPHGLCASSFVSVLVHHTEWDVPADFVSLHQLGNVTREL